MKDNIIYKSLDINFEIVVITFFNSKVESRLKIKLESCSEISVTI